MNLSGMFVGKFSRKEDFHGVDVSPGKYLENVWGRCLDPHVRVQSLCAAVVHCATLVNTHTQTHTHRQILSSYKS